MKESKIVVLVVESKCLGYFIYRIVFWLLEIWFLILLYRMILDNFCCFIWLLDFGCFFIGGRNVIEFIEREYVNM